MKINLTIIVPTLNNVAGVEYLRDYFKDKPYKIVMVDNSKTNLGFAGGVNRGAKDAETKWMLILNDDIVFQNQNTIEALISFAEKNNLDAVSPILRNPDGKVENYGYKILPFGKIELVKENYRLDPRLRGDDIPNTNIDGMTAACLLVRTEVFKKLGGFDEKFFAYLEDVDFFLRFKKDGYMMGIADIEVLHNHMTTSKTMGNFKARQDMINWWRLFFKHPEKFKFNLQFIIERLKNLSGFIKATVKIL